MQATLHHFSAFLRAALARHFGEAPGDETPPSLPNTAWIESLLPVRPTAGESIVFMLALAPHISPQTLDLFFIQNKDFDRPYTEFGGWKGVSHNGFLPTGQTAAFLIENGRIENEKDVQPVFDLFGKEHWFCKNNVLRLEGQGEGEPFLSGKIVVSEEILAKVFNRKYEPEYNSDFPAKRITTLLEWDDLVLPYNLREDIGDIVRWLNHQDEIRELWRLNRIVKPGYRCLFYGASGTGKTLTATLLGKQNGMDVYRVDLSMIVSKYIGETEKNLAKIFDKAAHRNWILFFDEADALFGKRTETQTSNDRHANQEVAYLLQRIEDFAGMVILATNLKDNIDEAFFRRFQSALCFPVPGEPLRYQLWQKMLPPEWLPDNDNETGNLLNTAAGFKLTGGSIVNAIQNCAIKLHGKNPAKITMEILNQAIKKELSKEGKLINQSS
jgi:AAA+ superfamily predicted ATPase